MTDALAFSESALQPDNLVDLLNLRAMASADRLAYSFLDDGDGDADRMTYADLDRRARAIAAALQDLHVAGQRALLLYPPGLEYIAAFFGCLYANVVAVPAYPPDPYRLNRSLPRLLAILADAQATVVLTIASIREIAEMLFEDAPELKDLLWVSTDSLAAGIESGWRRPAVRRDTLAFLQYTSGSTRLPRGVMLTHANLIHNCSLIWRGFGMSPDDAGFIWLPPYHDMGLIGGILEPIYGGISCTLMSPLSFLQRPMRWLAGISRTRATVSGGPNFAYDLCVRKIGPEERKTLDLSCWTVAFSGAEPVRPDTLDRFVEAFGPCGFRRDSLYPCYGLAEATLIVSGGHRKADPLLMTVDRVALERNRVVPAPAGAEGSQTLVSCGGSIADQEIQIVDPDTLRRLDPRQVGEIWVSGPSISEGYWNRPAENETQFQATLADDGGQSLSSANGKPPAGRTYLRTGDLGFLQDGELFITGRIKDLIIVDGRNHYPQDIETTVEHCHPGLRPGCIAAFSVEQDGEERLVVAAEVNRAYRSGPQAAAELRALDPAELLVAVRRAVSEEHRLRVHDLALLRDGTIPKTSSGKIQRHASRAGYLDGTLDRWGE